MIRWGGRSGRLPLFPASPFNGLDHLAKEESDHAKQPRQRLLQLGSLNDTIAEWQQQVTDGIGGILAGIELYCAPGTTIDTATVSIGLGAVPYLGAFVFTTTATFGQAGAFIDTSSADITLTPGEVFVIDVSSGGSADLVGVTQPYAPNPAL
jgi:hypothetical protein